MRFSRRTLLKASAASAVLGSVGKPTVALAQQDLAVSFQSFNFRGRFVRHRNFLVDLDPVSSASPELDKFDATFVFRHGGNANLGDGFASWEARNPGLEGHFLRHQNFRLVLHKLPPPGSPDRRLFDLDSTFIIDKESLAAPHDRRFQSFRALNFSTRYLRHRNFHLFLDELDKSKQLDREDATFETLDGLMPQRSS